MRLIDTLLVNGEHSTDGRGIPITIFDRRELIQRALLRLTIRKGSFEQDPALGSELYKLRDIRGGNIARMAQSYAQEALLPMPEVTVSGVVAERLSSDILRLFVSLEISQNIYQLEVDVS